MFIINNTAILLRPITLHKTIFVTYNDWSVEMAFEKGGNSIPQHLVLIINPMLVIKFFDLCFMRNLPNMEYGNIGYEARKKCNFTGLKFKLYSNANDRYLQSKHVKHMTAHKYRNIKKFPENTIIHLDIINTCCFILNTQRCSFCKISLYKKLS